MDLVLNWILRGAFIAAGVAAAVWILFWLASVWRSARERWPLRLALGMVLLAAIYGAGHGRLLLQRNEIEAGRARYTRFGDPRLAEIRRAQVLGWIMDCTDSPAEALAGYRAADGVVHRVYPLGQAGANLIGGGADTIARDYTIEHLFAKHLRRPKSFAEAGQLHPAGTDLDLTLCRDLTAEAWRLLDESGRPGAVIVQDVHTGAVKAYAATGGPRQAPMGIKRYAPPGSVFKLPLVALWWENDFPENLPIPCPARIQITPRASIGNYAGEDLGTVIGPLGMLVPSCNTAAVWMALYMRDRLGSQAFVDAYRRFGFVTYSDQPPSDTSVSDFWATTSDDWARRMSPPPSRVRISDSTSRAEWGQIAIGQGPVDVTVIGISRFIQAIGNDGVMLHPTLEQRLARREPEARDGRRIMSEQIASKLQNAMLQVVDHGTATTAGRLLDGLDWEMGGKTGTAEVPGRPDDGWFAGLAFDPEGDPEYSVVVYLEGGGPGGRMPAQIAARMVRMLASTSDATPSRTGTGAAK